MTLPSASFSGEMLNETSISPRRAPHGLADEVLDALAATDALHVPHDFVRPLAGAQHAGRTSDGFFGGVAIDALGRRSNL